MIERADPAEVIGRAAELEVVNRFLDRARGGLAGLVIDGDAGIGKTAMWRAAIGRAAARGARVLRSAPAESERTLTLGGLTDLLAEVSPDELGGLPAIQRRALEIALLRADATGQLPDQRTLSVAATALLRHLAIEQPLTVAVDDAQWLDGSSASILAYAIRRLTDRPVGVLLAVRGTLAGVATDLAGAVPTERLERLHLGAMPLAGLHQLFLARFGRSFPRLVLVRIEEASGGNPFYALEIARALVESGATVMPGASLPIPDSLEALVQARIQALPPRAQSALLLAAIAVEPTLDNLELAEPGTAAALTPAIEAGIATLAGGAVRFSHPLLAQGVMSMADPAELRQAHASLARSATSDDARARHLGGATEGRQEPVAAAIEAAAAEARNRGATLDAASLYQRAADLTPEAGAEAALRRATLAAETLFIDVSDIIQSDAILAAAIASASPAAGPARAEALSLRALIRYYHGQTPEAVRLAEQALAEVGDDLPLRTKVLGRAAFLVMQVDLERGHRLAAEALELLGRLGRDRDVDPDLHANLLLLHASSELGLVHGLLRDEIERGQHLITEHGRSWEHDGADGIDYGLARQLDEVDRAIAMTERLIRAKAGPGGDDPFNLVSLSGLQILRGDWTAALANAEAAEEGYAREGADVFPAWRLRGLALVDAHQGRIDAARTAATVGLELARAGGDLALEVYHRQILGFVALSVGDVHEADVQLTTAVLVAEASGTRHPGRFKLDGDLVEALVALGELERAEAVVERLEQAGRVAPTPWTLAVGARARGLVAAAHGDLDGALAALQRALLEHERLAMPFERARSLLVNGVIRRRRKEKRLADESLRAALDVFERLGAPVWADRARAELGRIGRRPRASEELTDTERRVAELAATGLSSREIAERAFLAPKTVGNVLGRVYGKLGIHSRAELGARMGQGSATAGSGTAESATRESGPDRSG